MPEIPWYWEQISSKDLQMSSFQTTRFIYFSAVIYQESWWVLVLASLMWKSLSLWIYWLVCFVWVFLWLHIAYPLAKQVPNIPVLFDTRHSLLSWLNLWTCKDVKAVIVIHLFVWNARSWQRCSHCCMKVHKPGSIKTVKVLDRNYVTWRNPMS